MYELKNGKVFTSKSVGTGPSSCEKRIYRAAVSQRLRNAALDSVEIRKMSFFTRCVAHNVGYTTTQHFRRHFYYILLGPVYLNTDYINCKPASCLIKYTDISELLSVSASLLRLRCSSGVSYENAI